MRSDNVMRHRKSHADLYSMDDIEARVELRLRGAFLLFFYSSQGLFT